MIAEVDDRLIAWAKWVREYNLPGSCGGSTIERRLMRTAPGKKTTQKLLTKWICIKCRTNHKTSYRPVECYNCKGEKFEQHSIKITTIPSKSKKPAYMNATLEDNTKCEETDTALAKLPDKKLLQAAKLKYLGGYPDEVCAKRMNVKDKYGNRVRISKTSFKSIINMLHYYLHGYFEKSLTEVDR